MVKDLGFSEVSTLFYLFEGLMISIGSFGSRIVITIASTRGDIRTHQMKLLLKVTIKGQVLRLIGGKKVRKVCHVILFTLG